MTYHDRHDSDPMPGDLRPAYHEMETSRSWHAVPQQDEEVTAYDPYTPQISLKNSTTKQSVKLEDDGDDQLPLRKALKKYPKIAGYCLAMTIPVIGWGYDLVVVGSVVGVDTFVNDYGEKIKGKMDIPGNWLSLWMGLPPAGAAFGSLLGGWLQNKIGRKWTLFMGTMVSVVAIACMFFSHVPEPLATKRMLLTAGLTIQGFTVGVIKGTCVTWVSENTPTALRGSAMALFPIFTLLGQLIGALVLLVISGVENKNGYLGAFGSQWILALGPLLLSIFMPESPAHLIRTGQEERAIKSAHRLYAPKINPYSQLEKIRATIEEEKANTASASYWACLKGTNLRRTLIVALAALMPCFFGLELLSSANVFLRSMGMASMPAMIFMTAGIVAGMFGNAVGFWLLSRTGRRNMIIYSLGVATLLWTAMGITGIWASEMLTWAAGGIMMAVIVTCGLGAWPASYAVLGETSSLQLRSLTQALASIADKGGSIMLAVTMPLLYSRDSADLGAKTAFPFAALSLIGASIADKGGSIMLAVTMPLLYSRDSADLGAKTAFPFAALSLIGTVLSFFFIPEMKGRSPIEIDQMFEMGLSARKFQGYRTEKHDIQEASPLASHSV